MAKALIIDDPFGKQALNFYTRFPEERYRRGITLVVEQPELVRHMSLDTLLDAIIDSWANKTFEGPDLVLVSHGNQRGLTMRLFPGHRTDSRTEVLETLMGADSSAQKVAQLHLREAQVDQLIDKMNEVRGLNLGSVEFRGCNIGLQQHNVEVLKTFLGASSVSGPDLLSTFGYVHPRIGNERQMDHWVSQFGRNAHVSSHPSGRFGFHFNGASHQIRGMTESASVLPEWIAEFLSPSSPGQLEGWMRGRIPVHFLVATPPVFPWEDAYLDHLVRTT